MTAPDLSPDAIEKLIKHLRDDAGTADHDCSPFASAEAIDMRQAADVLESFLSVTPNSYESTVAQGFDFTGCSDWNGPAEHCLCETWEETVCAACDEPIRDAQQIGTEHRNATPWLPIGSEHIEWETIVWHIDCDDVSAATKEES